MTTRRSNHRAISSKQLEHKFWRSPVQPHVFLAAIWAHEASQVCLSEATQDEAGWPSPRYCIFPQSYHPPGDCRSHLETRCLVSSWPIVFCPSLRVCLIVGDRHATKTPREAPPVAGDSPRLGCVGRVVLCCVVSCRVVGGESGLLGEVAEAIGR
jgi:hypothetical protein